MRLALASDLHHEFYSTPPALEKMEADVLVLAGDIETVRSHNLEWWEDQASHYDKVIYIRGNHEYYKTYYSEFPKLQFPDNVIVVGRMPQVIEFDGVKFLAGTMWTNLSSPIDDNLARGSMNDYRLIKYSRDRYWFTPADTTAEWNSFRIMLHESKPNIVISHHLPSYGSVPEQYKDDRLNAAYATEMDVEGVKLWMHGHTHEDCDYVKQGCRIVCHPKGYPNEFYVKSEPVYIPKVIEYEA